MKKSISLLLIIFVLLSFVSCSMIPGDTKDDSTIGTPAVDTPAVDTPAIDTPAIDTPTEDPGAENVPTEKPSTLSVCGNDISEYVIVYPLSNELEEKTFAEQIAAHIKSEFNIEVPVVSDDTDPAEIEILVGQCNPKHFYGALRSKLRSFDNYKMDYLYATIVTLEDHLYIAADNKDTMKAAVDRLIAEITAVESGSAVSIDYSDNDSLINAMVELSGDALKVMSYNIYTNNPNRIRCMQVASNIANFDPDVFGVQELNTIWIKLLERYSDIFDEYEMVGKPRMNEKDTSNGNEYSAIFYKKDKFDLIEESTKWLSDTPEEISKLDGSEYYRIMTYAVFERKSDGKRFMHVNTHLGTEKDVRFKQLNIMLEIVGGLLEKHGDIPVYFTGDYNMRESEEAYSVILNRGYGDTRNLFDKENRKATCGTAIIDYCFVSKDDFYVTHFDVGYGLEGSDHYPVCVELYIK